MGRMDSDEAAERHDGVRASCCFAWLGGVLTIEDCFDAQIRSTWYAEADTEMIMPIYIVHTRHYSSA